MQVVHSTTDLPNDAGGVLVPTMGALHKGHTALIHRAKLLPGMYSIFDAAKAAGAHCAYLSGGGSTICALCSDNERGIADAMLEAASSREVKAETLITAPTERGAEIMETN